MNNIDRFKGCLLGLALGDALGAPFEGSYHGSSPVLSVDLPEVLRYTDDTEMAIGVTESLISSVGFNPDDMALKFVDNYHSYRGYGPGTTAILNMIRRGVSWGEANKKMFVNGSFGNGAAMRVAPLGLFYSNDAERLRKVVEEASSITHSHPLGKEGAVILAYAISLILIFGDKLQTFQFLDKLISFTCLEEYSEKLRSIKGLLLKQESIESVITTLGNSVLAHESVPTALYAFLCYGGEFKKTLEFCISLGGDTDTIGAMAGALSGCLIGTEFLPNDWLCKLEDAEKGRQYISNISEELYKIHLSYYSSV
jgi:poly(ADP-ribose) glycohydrolase ARH3